MYYTLVSCWLSAADLSRFWRPRSAVKKSPTPAIPIRKFPARVLRLGITVRSRGEAELGALCSISRISS